MTQRERMLARPARTCCCWNDSAWDCWRNLHDMRSASNEQVIADGGPCECICHDDIEDGI